MKELFHKMVAAGFNELIVQLAQPTNKKFDSYYLIDYENTKSEGLEGLNELSSKSSVIIFHNRKDTFKYSAVLGINNTKAQVNFVCVDTDIKNALDCKLLFTLEDLLKEHKKATFLIISKDNDYNPSILKHRANGFDVVKKASIKSGPSPIQKSKQQTAAGKDDINEKD